MTIKSVEVFDEEGEKKLTDGIGAGKTVSLNRVKITLDVDSTLANHIDNE